VGPTTFPPEARIVLFAAVVIPVVRYPDPAVVFVRRTAHLRRNPGQIAFPGGIIDPGDADSEAAALREFEEELGIARDRVRIVERLENVVTLALSVTVTPYLGSIAPPIAYAYSPDETAAIHEIPVHAIYAPGALTYGIERGVRHGERTYDVPSWLLDYEDVHIWGATARMLHALISRFPRATDLERALDAVVGPDDFAVRTP
jgi:8-oxo-dGTP pyrophosphatase MutT (NUDIX family)